MSRPLDQMTDVQHANRVLFLWVPRRLSRWKRFAWGVCMGRLWVQWTPGKDVGGIDVDRLGSLAMACYGSLARLGASVDDPVVVDVKANVKAYVGELECWCGVDRSAIWRPGGP